MDKVFLEKNSSFCSKRPVLDLEIVFRPKINRWIVMSKNWSYISFDMAEISANKNLMFSDSLKFELGSNIFYKIIKQIRTDLKIHSGAQWGEPIKIFFYTN